MEYMALGLRIQNFLKYEFLTYMKSITNILSNRDNLKDVSYVNEMQISQTNNSCHLCSICFYLSDRTVIHLFSFLSHIQFVCLNSQIFASKHNILIKYSKECFELTECYKKGQLKLIKCSSFF